MAKFVEPMNPADMPIAGEGDAPAGAGNHGARRAGVKIKAAVKRGPAVRRSWTVGGGNTAGDRRAGDLDSADAGERRIGENAAIFIDRRRV